MQGSDLSHRLSVQLVSEGQTYSETPSDERIPTSKNEISRNAHQPPTQSRHGVRRKEVASGR